MKLFPPERLHRLLFQNYWQRTGGMLGFAIVLGFLGGSVAFLFKSSLGIFERVFLNRFPGFGEMAPGLTPWPKYLFFLVPALGGLISGVIVYGIAPEAEGAGTDALIDAFHNRGGQIRFRAVVVKFVASLVTLGTGGSAGQEGPIAQVGGGIGSLMGRVLRLPEKHRRILLLTGTAAGLGAIFHAPLGSALTAAEIVYKEDFESEGFLPFTVASVVAFAFYSVLTHQSKAYLEFPVFPFANPLELFNYALVGLVCVPFSWAYVGLYRKTRAYFKGLPIKNYYKPAIGGLLVGILAYVCPQAVGTGWTYLRQAVSGSFGFSLLLFIALGKIIATSLTIGSGGSGGVFGPSLFIGGMVGGVVGFGLQEINPHWVTNPGSYVLVGMGAFFAGAAKAPLAGLIMVCEITGNYGLLPPLLIATILHLVLSRKWSLYDSQRKNKFFSPVHEHSLKVDMLRDVPLTKIFTHQSDFVSLRAEDLLSTAMRKTKDAHQEVFPVLNSESDLIGMVTAVSLNIAAMESAPDPLVLISDLMTETFPLQMGMDLREVLSLFLESGATQLPVVMSSGKTLGLLRLHEVMEEYDRLTRHVEERVDLSAKARHA